MCYIVIFCATLTSIFISLLTQRVDGDELFLQLNALVVDSLGPA